MNVHLLNRPTRLVANRARDRATPVTYGDSVVTDRGGISAVYFDGHDLTRPLIVLAVYTAAGNAAVLLLAGRTNPVMRFPGR